MRLLKENYEGLEEVDRLSEALKTALKTILLKPDIQKALQNNDFDIIYGTLPPNLASQFTQLMNSLDIDPLNYLDHIPESFLAYTTVKSIDIPDHIKEIGDGAFYNCSYLKYITIPDSVTSIGYEAFRDCTGLTSIVIPDSVTSIEECAFYNCNELTSVTIGSGVIDIGKYAFSGEELEEITYKGTREDWRKIHKAKFWRYISSIKTIHCIDGDIKL